MASQVYALSFYQHIKTENARHGVNDNESGECRASCANETGFRFLLRALTPDSPRRVEDRLVKATVSLLSLDSANEIERCVFAVPCNLED